MTTDTATTGKQLSPLKQLCQGLQVMSPQFEQALPKGMSVDRFIRVATNAIQMHPQKEKLISCDRQSLFLACQKAAGDGLYMDGREAALIVFGDQAQYIPMVQGIVKLARNSGQIAKIGAWVVYENDKFTYRLGLDEMPTHEPDWKNDTARGKPIGAWYLIKLTNGEVMADFLSRGKIMRIAGKSKNAFQYDPEKGPYYEEWWKKTAIKNGLKYAPKSTELERALEAEVEDFDTPLAETATVVNITEEQPKRRTRAAKAADTVTPAATETPPVIEAEYTESSLDDRSEGEELPI